MQSRISEDAKNALLSTRNAIGRQKFVDEQSAVEGLLRSRPYDADAGSAISVNAADLVLKARRQGERLSILDRFLTEYGLSNEEGVALMCLAESLLRVSDGPTAKKLIADKISSGNWAAHANSADSLLVNASTLALMLTGSVVKIDRDFTKNPRQWLSQLANRLSGPVVEVAVRGAMQILGREFVLGKTIDKALGRAVPHTKYSYDMLGEAARTTGAAEHYKVAYSHAIRRVADTASAREAGSSVSIKLSALHPRYEYSQHERVMTELIPIVKSLCLEAAEAGIDLTIDAEECDRLELSLDIFETLARDPDISDWNGLGIVVQAYSKRATFVIDWLETIAEETRRRIPVRLVKGAYWDAEIKNAQEMGYPDLPVFTRKWATDCSYLCCARALLEKPEYFQSQFATHNAHTVAAVMHLAGGNRDFEFQRLHGMGAALYASVSQVYEDFPPIRIYAPVGGYDDLLAYLVRRLLENGANSSFVNRFLDKSLPPADIVEDPFSFFDPERPVGHPSILLAADIFGSDRKNSSGVDLTDSKIATSIETRCRSVIAEPYQAGPIIFGKTGGGNGMSIRNPADNSDVVGQCTASVASDVDRAMTLAATAQSDWFAIGADARATILEIVASELEINRDEFLKVLCREAGKTIPDAIAEVREAVDFCRYYAVQARRLFVDAEQLPGPSGETNVLTMQGRGVFVCISPWNFPLAIFLGQITAALAAGNSVVAKPAEETPIVASLAVKVLHQAGVPVNACQLIVGDGEIGAMLVGHERVAGVAFTGSTETARKINITLSNREGAIVPLIAETGGQNVLIADSTTLLEQLTDDVIQSAFHSAGQRCSALRVLFIQEEIAEAAIEMIRGAMRELVIGNPGQLRTDVGPIISADAASQLESHVQVMNQDGKPVFRLSLPSECDIGSFVAPTMIEIDGLDDLDQEHFGPILHVVRYRSNELDEIIAAVERSGYGLTLGIHSRIESRSTQIAADAKVGNVYVNRNMVGAVVGSQPFGGCGLSGTGPKAGGPHYLLRFATEKVVSINTVATGGNAELLQMKDPDQLG
ncbi:MAG: bifunctional proline dehydrogenase/L-glutamate gamma-semialdehyde dehydrogenase PutA [Candidatus Azotimanducaceae bacterium WSBS_2022_MAG_OTU7]